MANTTPWWETEGSNVVAAALPPGAEPAECAGCRQVLREDELFDGLCEQCFLLEEQEREEAYWLAVEEGFFDEVEDPRDEYTFQRDQRLI